MVEKKQVKHVASLAKLSFDDKTLTKLSGQMQDIMNMIDELSEVDTQGVKPTTHISRQETAFREDKPQQGESRDELLKNVPEQKDGLIKVPSIIDESGEK